MMAGNYRSRSSSCQLRNLCSLCFAPRARSRFRSTFFFLLFAFWVAPTCSAVVESKSDALVSSHQFNDESHKVVTNQTHRYKLVSFKFDHVEVPYVICLWILLACIAKIGKSLILMFLLYIRRLPYSVYCCKTLD